MCSQSLGLTSVMVDVVSTFIIYYFQVHDTHCYKPAAQSCLKVYSNLMTEFLFTLFTGI